MGFAERLRELLCDDKLKAAIDGARRKVLALAKDPWRFSKILGGKTKDFAEVEAGRLHPAESYDVGISATFNRSEYEQVFQRFVLDRLAPPLLITLSELSDAFRQHLLVRDEEFDAAYPVFRGNILRSLKDEEYSQSWPLAYEMARYGHIEDSLADGVERAVWDADDIAVIIGDSVDPNLAGWHDAASGIPTKVVLVRLFGDGTPTAWEDLIRHFRALLPSAMRSVILLGTDPALFPLLRLREGPTASLRLPIVCPKTDLTGQDSFFRACVHFSFVQPSKKDSMNRRIRNAIHLLVEADRQESDALGLAMCCTAMEALVCRKEKDSSIKKTLCENAAVLLAESPEQRPGAVKVIGQLYDKRCDALHGTKLETESEDRMNCRYLASGLLKAVWERWEYMAKMDSDPESPQAFFTELRHLVLGGAKTVVGVSPSPVCSLWRDA